MNKVITAVLALAVLAVAGVIYVLSGDPQEPDSWAEVVEREGEASVMFEVGPEKVACEGVSSQECLVVNGEIFYGEIQGFDYVEGTTYFIEVLMRKRKDAPADASEFEYTFVGEVSRE